MQIKVCVGSACHLKGSYDVIEELQKYIKNNNLEDDLQLKASFCLGQCTKDVSIMIDDSLETVNKNNVIEKIEKRVKGL